jgi:hypothetical protein
MLFSVVQQPKSGVGRQNFDVSGSHTMRHTHKHTHKHTQTHINTHTQKHTHTNTHTNTCTHKNTRTHKNTHINTHKHTHTHPVGLLWTSDQPVAEVATYTTHNKHKRRTYMPSQGFKPANPAIKRLQTNALYGKAMGMES